MSSFVYKPKILKTLKSPGFFMNTRSGALYQLTPHNAGPLNLNHLIISQSDFLQNQKLFSALKEQQKSFKSYLGFKKDEEKNKFIYLSPVDYYKQHKTLDISSRSDSVRLYSKSGGYYEMTDEEYYKISQQINPDILVSLTEIPIGKGKKSHRRSVLKTIGFLDQAIEMFRPKTEGNVDNTHKDKSTLIFASIEGGIYDDQRQESIQKSLERDIDGIVLHGIDGVQELEEKFRQIQLSMEELGENRDNIYSVYSSKGSLIDILLGLSCGIDYFEVDYPNQIAQTHKALNFDFGSENYEQTEPIPQNEIVSHLKGKNPKYQDMTQYDIHKDNLIGFTENCQCHSCKNHTQAYVAHLIKCKELTGTVLITIHNIHQYNLLFQQLQDAALKSKLPNYISWFIKNNLH